MSKISELSDGGSLVSTDFLIAVRSGGNVKVKMDTINVDQVDLGDNEFIRLGNSQDLTLVHNASNSIINQAGIGNLLIQKAGTTKASITANGLEFPDNSKAIFGAGSDLQIFSNGTSSYIIEGGSGNLEIRATDIFLKSADNTKALATFDADGAASISHNGSTRLATTATGIDVTGTATMDGLTVDGNPVINGTSPQLFLQTGASNTNWQIAAQENVANAFEISSGAADASAPDDTYTKRLVVQNTGDISFYNTAGTSQALYWNASEERLTVSSDSGGPVYLQDSNATATYNISELSNNAGNFGIQTRNSSGVFVSTDYQIIKNASGADYHRWFTQGIEQLRLDASGRLGIGTASNLTNGTLNVQSNGTSVLQARSDTAGVNDGDTTVVVSRALNSTAGKWANAIYRGYSHAWSYGSSAGTNQAMTIDSSGNLLVGKTTLDITLAGTELRANGLTWHTTDGIECLGLNRLTSDGKMLDFRVDSLPVGSIGSQSGDVYISSSASGHGGLRFANGSILPLKDGSLNAGEIDLGQASGDLGFKDLYLSGGVYLGGTVAANKLDDYEEGTFTPVMENVTGWSGSSGVDGNYTKIGNTVHVFISMTSNVALTGTPTNKITGLPFTSDLTERTSNVSVSRMFGINLTTTDYIAGVSGSEIAFSYVNGDNNTNNFTHSGSTLRFTLSATYTTAA